MPFSPRVLFAVSECVPFVKTGGLADVAGALPRALEACGAEVTVMLPGYAKVLDAVERSQAPIDLAAPGTIGPAHVVPARLAGGVRALIVARPDFYLRPGGPYQAPDGQDHPDNALRFGLLSYAAYRASSGALAGVGAFDILHCHDWQTGLAPAYRRWLGSSGTPPVVMTIHNLAYQGVFAPTALAQLGLPPESFSIDGVEYYGNLSFLKAGLHHADRITTVSPTYAREICSEPLGFGLQGLLATRAPVLDGILNGIDTDVWNPAIDPLIDTGFDSDRLERKSANTAALRARVGLAARPQLPLLGVVSRLIHQKGHDLVAAAALDLIASPAQLVVMGTGDPAIEHALAAVAREHPGTIAFVRGFDEPLSHLIEAGADIFLMPSRFEPCGLNQMYSQRYGTPPVVHRTGGLADSVIDLDEAGAVGAHATGFVFDSADAPSLVAAVRRAIAAWHDRPLWRTLQRAGMQREFGWQASARRYLEVYAAALATRAGRS